MPDRARCQGDQRPVTVHQEQAVGLRLSDPVAQTTRQAWLQGRVPWNMRGTAWRTHSRRDARRRCRGPSAGCHRRSEPVSMERRLRILQVACCVESCVHRGWDVDHGKGGLADHAVPVGYEDGAFEA